ncbi:hypothetical protein ACFYTF_26965 [Nocardia thailandica]|uniref:Uncharacterized protein n=1 Tax=Nocardia thailandica TaxID=257275 RepID=A0ABW6PW07_9NOCA
MARILMAVASVVAGSAVLAGCGGADDGIQRAASTSAAGITSAAVTSTAIPPEQLRAKACAEMLPKLENMRIQEPSKSRAQLVEAAIAVFSSWPAFQELSPEEQAATIEGSRDAIKGECG